MKVNVKPIVWTGPYKPGHHGISYDHYIADTVLGQIVISWKSWKVHAVYDLYEYPECIGFMLSDDLETLKTMVYNKFQWVINQAIESDDTGLTYHRV